jgi:hypothetical protein
MITFDNKENREKLMEFLKEQHKLEFLLEDPKEFAENTTVMFWDNLHEFLNELKGEGK